MSKDMIKGLRSRKILTILAAALAVALMLTVPLFAAVDTDADFTPADAGYTAKVDDATNAELYTLTGYIKSGILLFTVEDAMSLFNQTILDEPVASDDPVNYKGGCGEKITKDNKTDLNFEEVTAEKVKITISVATNGDLINPDTATASADVKAAANAIKAYLGEEVTTADSIEITGRIRQRVAVENSETYNLLDDNKCALKQRTETKFFVNDIELELKLIKTTETLSIKLIFNAKGMTASDWNYEYTPTPIAPGSTFVAKNTVTNVYSGDLHFEVDGSNYALDLDEKKQDDQSGPAVIFPQSDVVISPELELRIATLPSNPPDNMTLEKTYASVDSAVSDIVMEAVGDDILKIILTVVGIVIGVLVLIIVLIIILIIVKKKKKR